MRYLVSAEKRHSTHLEAVEYDVPSSMSFKTRTIFLLYLSVVLSTNEILT